MAESRTPRLLMVGVGNRTTDVLLPALQKAALPLEVTAICDPAPTTAAQAGDLAQSGLLPVGVAVYGDLGEALAAGSYEVAILACPHDEHQSLTLRLADAGIAVWKEKPYALTLNDAVQLTARARPGVRVLAHRPHGQLHQIAAQRLQAWGQLLSYRIRITRQTSDYSATWRASRQRAGGGAILDLGYHAFDLIARLAGRPATVYAVTTVSPAHRPAVEVEESAHLTITHADGCAGTVYLSRCDDWAEELNLVTKHGRMTIDGHRAQIQVIERGGLTHGVELTAADNPWARMLGHHTQTFSDPLVTAAEAQIGVRATALMEAAYTSLQLERPAPVASVDAPCTAVLEGLSS